MGSSPGMSPLTQGRGSKHEVAQAHAILVLRRPSHRGVDRNCGAGGTSTGLIMVAPHTGAWIETVLPRARASGEVSPLTQGRGSKLLLLANAYRRA